MVTMNIRVERKVSCEQLVHCLIRAAGHSAVKTDSGLRQRSLLRFRHRSAYLVISSPSNVEEADHAPYPYTL